MKVAIYRRVSTLKQADGFSLDSQLETLTALAEDHQATWEDFCDPGKSGETLEQRPAMTELLGRLDEFDAVLVVDESRLARDELVAATIRDRLRRTNTQLITPSGALDLNDPTARFFSGVIAQASQLEQGLRTKKSVAGLRKAAKAGFWPGGPPPYGYKIVDDPGGKPHKVLAIDEQQAEQLRLVYDLIVNQGYTTYSAARYLNAHGYRTARNLKGKPWQPGDPDGRLWRHSNLCFRLRQNHLTGTWIYKQGGDPIEVPIPPIFTDKEWATLQANIKGRPRSQRRSRLYPLTGSGRCHLRCDCGGNFFGKTDSSKGNRSYYECSRNHHSFGEERCGHRPRIIRAVDLEQSAWGQVIGKLTNEEYLLDLAYEWLADLEDPSTPSDNRAAIRRKLSTLNQEKTRIVRRLARNDELDALTDALADIRAEERALEEELEILDQQARHRVNARKIEQQLRNLAESARDRLANPTLELMAEVYDVLQLDLVRVAADRFEGTGSIPLTETGGEVWEEGPQRL